MNKSSRCDGRDGPANDGRLCVKGRFGFDYAHHPARLTKPLIRKAGVTKDPDHLTATCTGAKSSAKPAGTSAGLGGGQAARPARHHGKKALAGFGSAKGSNEEAYLFQKLVRTGFGSNNVDHCTRLCHASSVAALLEGVGSGAVSNPVRDVEHCRLHPRHRLQPHGQPPGGRHLDQERRRRAVPGSCWPTRAAPTSPATPGACCSSMPTPTWPCSTRCCTSS
jgi:anaerobic selenocysteine-containing dehydrogenase